MQIVVLKPILFSRVQSGLLLSLVSLGNIHFMSERFLGTICREPSGLNLNWQHVDIL